MIAAPVQGDVDRIPKGSHCLRPPSVIGPPRGSRNSILFPSSAERLSYAVPRSGIGLNELLDTVKRQLATASTHPYQVCTYHMCLSGCLLPELLREPDENSFRAPDVAEPIRVFVLDYFADELHSACAETGERIVDVLHAEHDA
jgi:hypothetical protein